MKGNKEENAKRKKEDRNICYLKSQ